MLRQSNHLVLRMLSLATSVSPPKPTDTACCVIRSTLTPHLCSRSCQHGTSTSDRLWHFARPISQHALASVAPLVPSNPKPNAATAAAEPAVKQKRKAAKSSVAGLQAADPGPKCVLVAVDPDTKGAIAVATWHPFAASRLVPAVAGPATNPKATRTSSSRSTGVSTSSTISSTNNGNTEGSTSSTSSGAGSSNHAGSSSSGSSGARGRVVKAKSAAAASTTTTATTTAARSILASVSVSTVSTTASTTSTNTSMFATCTATSKSRTTKSKNSGGSDSCSGTSSSGSSSGCSGSSSGSSSSSGSGGSGNCSGGGCVAEPLGPGTVAVVDLAQVEIKVFDMPLARVQLLRKSKKTGLPVVRRTIDVPAACLLVLQSLGWGPGSVTTSGATVKPSALVAHTHPYPATPGPSSSHQPSLPHLQGISGRPSPAHVSGDGLGLAAGAAAGAVTAAAAVQGAAGAAAGTATKATRSCKAACSSAAAAAAAPSLAQVAVPDQLFQAFIESPPIMPSDGAISRATTSYTSGLWHGLLSMGGFHAGNVSARSWKRDLGLIGRDKDAGRILAGKLFPGMKDILQLKKHHGRADALLIIAWAFGVRVDKDTGAVTQGPPRSCLPTDAYGNAVEYDLEGRLVEEAGQAKVLYADAQTLHRIKSQSKEAAKELRNARIKKRKAKRRQASRALADEDEDDSE